jgi:hypothetical protein
MVSDAIFANATDGDDKVTAWCAAFDALIEVLNWLMADDVTAKGNLGRLVSIRPNAVRCLSNKLSADFMRRL